MASWRQVCVTSDPTVQVIHGFPVSREPDGTRADVQVHEVIHHPTLKIVLYAVDYDLGADIHDLEICEVVLVAILVNGLIDLLIHLDPLAEVQGGHFRILILIIGASSLDVADVGHYQVLVVTF